MREIKFEFGFVNHAPVVYSLDELLAFPCMPDEHGGIKYKRQYTGLKDSSNPPKEIYEGDIVKAPNLAPLKVVEWHLEDTGFVCRHLPNNLYSENFFLSDLEWEVIGNIYTDSHLLEKL